MLASVAPGWYAVPIGNRRLLNLLADAAFEIWYSYAYHYVKVTVQNRVTFRNFARKDRVHRISEVEAFRLVNSAMARAAVTRYPGSRVEGKFTEEDVLNLLRLQNHLCVACQVSIDRCYTIDHIIPTSRGGSNNVLNIQLLCRSCNSSKGDRTMDEWLTATGRSGTPSIIQTRDGERVPSARFNAEVVRFMTWLDRVHPSGHGLMYEAATLHFKMFHAPEFSRDALVYPALWAGEATNGSDRLMWRLVPNLERFVFFKPMGYNENGYRTVTPYRRTDPELISFLDDLAGNTSVWRLEYELPPELKVTGLVRSRLDALPLIAAEAA